jgi:hypothetical protein
VCSEHTRPRGVGTGTCLEEELAFGDRPQHLKGEDLLGPLDGEHELHDEVHHFYEGLLGLASLLGEDSGEFPESAVLLGLEGKIHL